jgi:DeoR family glycerol-3-phosphate regulon repressor
MDPDAGLTTPNLAESETNRQFIHSAHKVVVVADHTKWGTQGMSTIAGFEDADEVISDAGLSSDARRILQESVSRLRIANAG